MKLIACVDEFGYCHDALKLLGALHFGNTDIILLHVIERITLAIPDPSATIPASVLMEIMHEQDVTAQKVLADARELLASYGLQAKTVIREGFKASEILEAADDLGADRIAVGSGKKGPFERFVAGSVSRRVVAHAHQSVLVGRNVSDSIRDGVHVVFATDHSEYANRAVDKLLAFAPQGIIHLTVMTAFPHDSYASIKALKPLLEANVGEAMKKGLMALNKEVEKKLKSLAPRTESVYSEQKPEVAIPQVMAEKKADLLIVAAHGHSWIRRMLIGSIAYDQAVNAPYSVFVIRV